MPGCAEGTIRAGAPPKAAPAGPGVVYWPGAPAEPNARVCPFASSESGKNGRIAICGNGYPANAARRAGLEIGPGDPLRSGGRSLSPPRAGAAVLIDNSAQRTPRGNALLENLEAC